MPADTGAKTRQWSSSIPEMLLQARDRGSDGWWRKLADRGTPLVERTPDGRARISFLMRWSSPEVESIYIDVNGVTDHHSFSPQRLELIPGTDIWMWQTTLPASWRGSYAFLPATQADRPPVPKGSEEEQRFRQRGWWRRIAAQAIPDPLNPHPPYPSGWGSLSSPLHLPDAPDQSAWDNGAGKDFETMPTSFEWYSAIQAKRRTVWSLFTAGPGAAAPADGYPLVLLLDGRNWVERMPVAPVLERLTAQGELPHAHYLLIDSIDGAHRQEDLAPNPAFWTAVWQELVPLAQDIAPACRDSARRIVAGQSFGGLAALYAALQRPDRWGGVIAQSASLWWPDPALLCARARHPGATGWLIEQLRRAGFPQGQLRIFMEVGSREDVMIDFADSLRAALAETQHDLIYRVFEGGHDLLCWRGGLIDGLKSLLAPTRHTIPSDKESEA